MSRAHLHHYLGSIEDGVSREVLSYTVSTQDWRKKIASFTQEDDVNLSAAWSRFKRIIRACPHNEYGENDLNTFFYDGLNESTKALIDSVVGG